jgi:hypothetical protein
MENQETTIQDQPEKNHPSGCLRLIKITSVIILVIIIIAAIWVKYNIYASAYTPVELSTKEQKVLDDKLSLLQESADTETRPDAVKQYDSSGTLIPEQYSEAGAPHEVSLTEKEMNSLVANTPETARRVAIDLSENLVSIKLVVPMDEEIIFLGGKTLRINVGIKLGYDQNGPVVAVKGVSLGGIPLPNAWLGYIKGKNLVEEFGTDGGFWQLFSEGIKDIKVKEGHILVRLNK